jgi:hypothetical protein
VNTGPDQDAVAEALVVFTAGNLAVLTAVDLPDGWMGRAILVPAPAGRDARDLNRRAVLSGFAGTMDLPVSLSEAHDAVLRGEDETDDGPSQSHT